MQCNYKNNSSDRGKTLLLDNVFSDVIIFFFHCLYKNFKYLDESK